MSEMDPKTAPLAKGSASTTREGFGETSIERRGETASTALEARARAEINARYVMALQRPRHLDVVRIKLLAECDRPLFAHRAFFCLPKGDKPGRLTGRPNCIEGLSVRFAERAISLAGNLWLPTSTIYDDDFKRMIRVSAIDLESNAIYERDIVIDKTIERRAPKEGEKESYRLKNAVILGKRTNSAGADVFIVQATDDELLQKEGALISKTFRTLGLRHIPPDILEDCEQRIVSTWRDEDAKNPDETRKRLFDAFAKVAVSPDQLKAYLGHEGARLTPDERLELGGLVNAIRENEVTWTEALAEKTARRQGTDVDAAGTGGAKSVQDRLAERAKLKEEAAKLKREAEAKAKVEEMKKKPEREPGQEG